MIFIESFLTRVLYDCLKLLYAYLNKGDKVREYYSCLKIKIQVHLHFDFVCIILSFLQYQPTSLFMSL